eukprot:2158399-Rhodomonas_salina.1
MAGVNFGQSPPCVNVRIGQTIAQLSTWISDTSVTSSVEPGVGKEHDITLYINGQAALADI